MRPAGRVIGLDLGSRRIGVAVTDRDQRVATPVTTIARGTDPGADHRAIAEVVAEYEAVGVVVGLPISLSGRPGSAAASILNEVEQLRLALPVDVITQDERLTTRQAAGALREAGRSARQQRPVIDQAAATLLLQAWIDHRRAAS